MVKTQCTGQLISELNDSAMFASGYLYDASACGGLFIFIARQMVRPQKQHFGHGDGRRLDINFITKKSPGAKRSAGVPGYNFYSRSEEHVFRNR